MEKPNTIRIPVPPADPILAHRDPTLMLRSKMALWSGRKLTFPPITEELRVESARQMVRLARRWDLILAAPDAHIGELIWI
jgi:hypothetical protein